MTRYLNHTPIIKNNLLEIVDVRCTAPHSLRGVEEYNQTAGFIFPRRGLFEWHTPEDGTALADCNTGIFIGAGQSYRIEHPAHGGDDCITARFDSDALLDALPCAPESLHTFVMSALAQYRLRLLLVSLRAPHIDALGSEELGLTLLTTVSEELGANHLTKIASLKEIHHVRSLLAAQPAADLRLAEIAKMVNLSPYHLARRFRAATGTSIHQYRMQIRLALALDHISRGYANFSALAADLGFSSHSHFSQAFKKAYGRAPSNALSSSG